MILLLQPYHSRTLGELAAAEPACDFAVAVELLQIQFEQRHFAAAQLTSSCLLTYLDRRRLYFTPSSRPASPPVPRFPHRPCPPE